MDKSMRQCLYYLTVKFAFHSIAQILYRGLKYTSAVTDIVCIGVKTNTK